MGIRHLTIPLLVLVVLISAAGIAAGADPPPEPRVATEGVQLRPILIRDRVTTIAARGQLDQWTFEELEQTVAVDNRHFTLVRSTDGKRIDIVEHVTSDGGTGLRQVERDVPMGSLELRQTKGSVELVHREREGLDAKALFPKRLALTGPSGAAEAWVTFDRDELYRPESIVFMLDASGSMRGERLAQAKQAILEATAELHSKSEIALFVLYDCGSIVHEIRFGDERERLTKVIDGIEASGGTPLGEAISQAFDYLHSASKHPPDHRRLVVLSDGQSTCGIDPISVVEGWDEALRTAQGFDIVGISLGAGDEAALKRLAKAAGGKMDAGEETDVVERTRRTIRGW